MTLRAYYTDSYTHQFEARVAGRTRYQDRPALVLDHTYFYPSSGGQPHDIGLINGLRVVDVITRDEDAAVLHVLEGELPEDVDAISGHVDWGRRFDHMQHHTGQHILTQAFVQIAGVPTVGFHLSSSTVTIDLETPSLADSDIAEAEALANRIIWENHPVSATIVDLNDTANVRIRRLPPHLLTGGLRVIDIDGFDVTACGGTHVAGTGEIGLLKVIRAEKRGDKTRIEFCCGGRALQDYRARHDVTSALAASLSVGLGDIPASVARLQDAFRSAQRELKAAASALLTHEAQAILAALEPDTRAVLVHVYERRAADDLKTLANALVARPGTVALLASVDDKTNCVFARSADLNADMGALLKTTLAALGGRGGGQPTLAQGAAPTVDASAVRAALDQAAASLA